MNSPSIAGPRTALHRLGLALGRDRHEMLVALRHGAAGLLEMASPRGRCNRKAFLTIALTFLGLQTAFAAILWWLDVEIGATGTLVTNAPILWIGTTICIKRLHDIGRRGWWLPAVVVLWAGAAFLSIVISTVVLGAVERGEPAFVVAFAAVTLPAFAALLWLHTRASEPQANRFGPVPTGFGLSLPAPGRSTRAPRTFYASAVLA